MTSLQNRNSNPNENETDPLIGAGAGAQDAGANYGAANAEGNPDLLAGAIGLNNEKRRNKIMFFLNFGLMVLVIVALSAYASCSHALNIWLAFQLVYRFLDLNLRCTVLHWLGSQNETDFSLANIPMTLKVYGFFVEFFYLAVTIAGTVVYFTMNECSDEDELDTIVLILLFIGWLYYGIPVLVLILLCVCLPCIYMMMEYNDRSDPNRPRPASQEMIDGLAHKKYDKDETFFTDLQSRDANPSCSVCFNSFEHGEDLIKLSCEHFFHDNCITGWLKTNGICPVCRKRID